MAGNDEKQENAEALEAGEDSVTYKDVLLTLAMDQLQTGERVDVIGTLTMLGMEDVVETARIAQEVEDEEDDEEDLEGSAPETPETAGDSELLGDEDE